MRNVKENFVGTLSREY